MDNNSKKEFYQNIAKYGKEEGAFYEAIFAKEKDNSTNRLDNQVILGTFIFAMEPILKKICLELVKIYVLSSSEFFGGKNSEN